MTKQKKGKDVEIQISSAGKKKILVASNCSERIPIKTKLGIGKKKKFLTCDTFEIVDADIEAQENMEYPEEKEDIVEEDIDDIPGKRDDFEHGQRKIDRNFPSPSNIRRPPIQ